MTSPETSKNNPADIVSIVIPVHNQLHYTRQCLASIEENTDSGGYEVIVVDDASTDGTAEFLQEWSRRKNWFRSVTNSENSGFARSCNRGAELSSSHYLLFLNNDTVVTPGWLSPLLDTLKMHPDIGIVAPKLVFPDGAIQHCGKVWGEWQAARSHPDHIYYREPGESDHVNRARDYQTLTGACLLLRRDEFFRYGPFDEQYENGWEDDDLCYACREQGLRVHYFPASTVIHFQSATLNDGLSKDEIMLKELSYQAESASAPNPMLLEMHQKIEQRLLAIRGRFDRNRSRFFSKWGRRIFRDDYLHIRADGLETRMFKELPPQPLVSIIILTFNQLPYTIECVESILRHTPEQHELIFVDNGSGDGTVQWLRDLQERYPLPCTVIANDANRGFAAGCNQGLDAARGDYLLLLNNDVVVTRGWLSGLLNCFRLRPGTGLAGPLTNNISGVQRLPGSPSGPGEGLDAFAEKLNIQFGGRRIYQRRIVGFCMLFSRELLNKVGYLDESFGSGNFEDDDYCLRAELEGYRNVIAGDVFIHHYGSVSFHGNGVDYGQSMSGNRSVFNRKWSRSISEPLLARKAVTLKTSEEADRLNRLGQSNAAVDLLLKEGIARIPQEPRFYRMIAEILLEGGMAEEALQTLEHTPDLERDGAALLLMARAASLLERRDLVDSMVNRVKLTDPARPALALISGMSALMAGDAARALREFGAAARMDISNEEAYLGLARSAELRNDLTAAFDLYLWGFIVAPHCREAARGAHRLADTPGKAEHVRKSLEEALHFKEDDRDLRYLLIDLLIRSGDLEKALDLTERAVVLFGADRGLVDAALSLRRSVGPLTISQAAREGGVSVSLCMIAKNEAGCLPRCLASLKPIVDEIILCDTGSTDMTREIAEAFGARVVDHPWDGNFSTARNRSLAEATGAWILVMDADEVISPLDYDAFRLLVHDSQNLRTAFTITTRNYTNRLVEKWQEHDSRYPVEEAGRGWMPSDKVRLFPNSADIRFENAVHEMVEPSLDRLHIPASEAKMVVVHHYGYLDDDRQEAKKTIYYEIGLKKYVESGGSPKATVELAIQAASLEKYEEAIALWNKALEHNPESALAYFNLGYLNLCLGRYDAAAEATKQSLCLKDDYREALANLAIIEVLRGRDDEAIRIIDCQVSDQGDYAMFDLIRAVLFSCAKEHERSTECFRSVAERNIEFGIFIKTTAKHLRQAGRDADADAVVRAAREAGCCVAD